MSFAAEDIRPVHHNEERTTRLPTDHDLSFAAVDIRPVHNIKKIMMNREPYKEAVMPVLPYSRRFQERFPNCVAWGANDIFVLGPDGKVRRFPVDKDARYLVYSDRKHEEPERIGVSLSRQTDFIYDAHRNEIHKTFAQYRIDPFNATMAFEVNGVPVRSISAIHAVYPLPGGKWMIPQPEFRDCTYACEEMLLAEGKTDDQVLEQMRNFTYHGRRRDQEEYRKSLQARSGREPKVVDGKWLSSADSLEKLQSSIAAYGPCILGLHGHARILDSIEKTSDGYLMTLRDPFSASFLKIMDHPAFWADPWHAQTAGPETRCNWDATFLPK